MYAIHKVFINGSECPHQDGQVEITPSSSVHPMPDEGLSEGVHATHLVTFLRLMTKEIPDQVEMRLLTYGLSPVKGTAVPIQYQLMSNTTKSGRAVYENITFVLVGETEWENE